jgi:hypothetical protein
LVVTQPRRKVASNLSFVKAAGGGWCVLDSMSMAVMLEETIQMVLDARANPRDATKTQFEHQCRTVACRDWNGRTASKQSNVWPF